MIKYSKLDTPNNKHYTFLNEGEIFKFEGEIFSYIRCKRGNKSIVAKKINNGVDYSIRIYNPEQMLEIIGRQIFTEEDKTLYEKCNNDLDILNKGDFFLIATGKNQTAELYKYERKHGKKIIASNPFTNKEYRIDPGFKFIKVSTIVK